MASDVEIVMYWHHHGWAGEIGNIGLFVTVGFSKWKPYCHMGSQYILKKGQQSRIMSFLLIFIDSSLVCVPNFMKPLLFTQWWLSPADHMWQSNLHCCDRGLLFWDFPWFPAWHASDGCLRQPSEVEYGSWLCAGLLITGFHLQLLLTLPPSDTKCQ